jgi:putative inorganic carbon (hco3(-)) transporter
MLDKIIFYAFSILFLITPLIWTSKNYELFEFNKMLFVYALTIIIVGTWFLKILNLKSLIINRSPLDIPILLFLGANILSTIFSIDPHTSIWGYYSRSNGGLLSIISYTLLYFALTSNLSKEHVIKLLKFGVLGGVLVSLYAIPEHFGVSPSCVILQNQFRADCWIQDVQSRVFATLGQPNWLAAYLGMLIFPAFYFYLTANTRKYLISFFLSLIALYLAFTFTYSRGGTLGFLAGLGVFCSPLLLSFLRNKESIKKHGPRIKSGMTIIISFLLINILFGSALIRFNLANFNPPTTTTVTSGTQLESGGSESGAIRLIVWQGALDIFKHYPLLGSGVETFAYSYYQFRPASHNLVSEWDFLYNKAHNEFLNYLATTGIIGFTTYLLMIGTFIFWCFKYFVIASGAKQSSKGSIPTKIATDSSSPRNDGLLILSLLAAYISYLVQNIFSFSVVIIAVFFYLFPAIAFVASESIKPFSIKLNTLYFILHTSYFRKALQALILLISCYLLLLVINTWRADRLFKIGQDASELGNPGKAYNNLSEAIEKRPFDPFYRSELGYAAASAAIALEETDATLSAHLKEQANLETELGLSISPNNTSLWRTAIRTYFELSASDESYNQKTVDTINKTIELAPTDAKLYYNKAVILGQLERNDEAMEALNQAIKLKPNYREAYLALGLFHFDKKDYPSAVSNMQTVLKLVPGDPEATQHLIDWGNEGISTESANK